MDNYPTEKQLEGDEVPYQYKGDLYTIWTRHDLGSILPVRVLVVPVE